MAGINLDVSGLKVLLEPVSAQTFSLTVPSAVPAVVEVLATGPQGPGVPFFGNTDDVLVKASDVSFDTEWTDEITVDAVQFDVAADEGEPVTGQLVWNAEEGTLDLGLNGVEGTFLHVGQEEMFRVSNRTGATIAKGAVVGFGGTIGQSGKLLGVLFDASSAPAKTIMGVAADDILNDADGYVVAFGKVRKVNTAVAGWVEGDILFADPAVPGGLTRVQPQSPNAIVTVAALVTRSDQVGELFVRPTFAGSLSETQDVRLTAPADGEVLAYDGALGLWVNEPVPADAVQSVNGQTGTVVLDAADVGAYADDNPSGFVDASGAAAAAPVQSVNSLSGTVVLDAAAVGAYPSSNPDNFIDAAGAPVQSVNGASGTVVLAATDVGAYPDSNPSGFVDAAGAAAAAPVQSVNGASGTVVLDATDVGAYPDTNPSNFIDSGGAPVQSVNGLAGTVVLDAAAVGAYADSNPSNFVDAAGAAAAAPVQTVNGASGTVVLDSDDVGAIGTATGLFVFDYGTAIPDVRPDAAAVFWRGTAQPGTAIALSGDIWYDSTGD
jgi:hypothetical protein